MVVAELCGEAGGGGPVGRNKHQTAEDNKGQSTHVYTRPRDQINTSFCEKAHIVLHTVVG